MSGVWVRVIVIIASSILGSGMFWAGIWAYIQKRDTRAKATVALLMGVAYREITTLGLELIGRGSITMDEFTEFQKYFFEPYKALGGNGSAARIMRQIENLPIEPHAQHPAIFTNTQGRHVQDVQLTSRAGQTSTPQ